MAGFSVLAQRPALTNRRFRYLNCLETPYEIPRKSANNHFRAAPSHPINLNAQLHVARSWKHPTRTWISGKRVSKQDTHSLSPMSIHHNKENQEFHLQNDAVSYIVRILNGAYPAHVYFGRNVAHRDSFAHLIQRDRAIRAVTVNPDPSDVTFSLELTRQEYPGHGKGDFREPAFELLFADGTSTPEFHFVSHSIRNGKPGVEGLPATYVEADEEAETLELVFEDSKWHCTLHLFYTIFCDRPVITRHAIFRNAGAKRVVLHRAMSTSVDFPSADYELLHLSGAWSRERHLKTRPLAHGITRIDSKRGASSHHHNPFVALKAPHTTEETGEVFGFSLVYSGNFMAQAEVDHFDVLRVMIGLNPFDFQWALDPGESFSTPEALMAYSCEGLQGMSRAYHSLYRERLARGTWRDKARPVLLNNWEATYFDFDEQKLVSLASEARDLGIELFVLDDGWFGERNDDTTSLGDWVVDGKKLPNGIGGLAEKIHALGLKFGLWFEPEMISRQSRLFDAHPEWLIQVPGRTLSAGRNQHILDLSRREVREYLFEALSAVLKEGRVDYVKWDMNRNMSEIGSLALPADRQQETVHRYMLGLYELLERLTTECPEVLFESCASGGGRFDPGMLYYMPQTWTSDDTDAVERLKIQYGTSMVYPLSAMGAHVSAVPNHQVGRTTSMEFRGRVAFFGTFGFELDITSLTDADKAEIRRQIAFYKKHRDLIRTGEFFRLKSPFSGNETAWMVVSPDQSEAIVAFYEVLGRPNPGFRELKLRGLDPDRTYRIAGAGYEARGDELMFIGHKLAPAYTGTSIDGVIESGDFTSQLFTLKSIKPTSKKPGQRESWPLPPKR